MQIRASTTDETRPSVLHVQAFSSSSEHPSALHHVHAARLTPVVHARVVLVGVVHWQPYWDAHSHRMLKCLIIPHQHPYCFPRWDSELVYDLPSFGFIPAVLEPDFYLSLCEFQGFRQIGSFGAGEILLSMKAALQLEDLRI